MKKLLSIASCLLVVVIIASAFTYKESGTKSTKVIGVHVTVNNRSPRSVTFTFNGFTRTMLTVGANQSVNTMVNCQPNMSYQVTANEGTASFLFEDSNGYTSGNSVGPHTTPSFTLVDGYTMNTFY